MNYKGIIIEESLNDASILRDVKILTTKVEEVTTKHQTPWLPQWTLHTVEIPEEKANGASLGIPSYQLDFAPKDFGKTKIVSTLDK